MRDRLKKLILENDILCHTCGENTDTYCAEYLAEYLIENGVIVPPCKVGTKVYCACLASGECVSGKVLSYSLNASGLWIYCNYEYGVEYWHIISDFGKTVFLTREEAEQALRGAGS